MCTVRYRERIGLCLGLPLLFLNMLLPSTMLDAMLALGYAIGVV